MIKPCSSSHQSAVSNFHCDGATPCVPAPGRKRASIMLASNNKGCYEEDHLISLENGGDPRDPRNLWPEPYKTQVDGQTVGARQKDTVENYIRNAICFNVPGHKSHGTVAHASMTLQRGQEILAGDWYACFVTIKQGRDCK